MGRIQLLPESVARRIAAGEVIERPASVVKELVENALDAGAVNIVVEVERGGCDTIAVADDGEGMSREDLPLAFLPHATSKIRTEEDLLEVRSLGFRGEALPSIAAVSEVRVWTRRRVDPTGTFLRVRGGEIGEPVDAGAPPGCRVEVRDLFFNTPVRRKFLKSPAAEASRIAQTLARLALAWPEIGFRLLQDGRETLALPPGDWRSRIRKILGRELDEALVPLESTGRAKVEGFASHPRLRLSSPRHVYWFVNRRPVRDRMLQQALLAAYSTLIPRDQFPAAVVRIEVAPGEVDVNVHPTKAEIRFRHSQAVFEAVRLAVLRAFAPQEDRMTIAPLGAETGTAREVPAGCLESAGEVRETGPVFGFPRPNPSLEIAAAEPAAVEGLFPGPGPLARLRIVGQVFAGYLVCEGEDEVVLVDQHAAHERVTFERLRRARRSGGVPIQPLLLPRAIELPPGEAEAIVSARRGLAELGFELEAFGDRTVVVRAVPALFPPGDLAPLVRALAAELAEVEGSRAFEEAVEELLATIACHSAIRVGRSLSEAEIRALLADLDELDLSTSCPHGRPVAVRLSRPRIEAWFGRGGRPLAASPRTSPR
jgi:DNA mismatch repair protein MutL